MADKIPVKAIFTGLDVTALGEFEPTDTIPLSLISGFPAGVTTELGNNSIATLGDVLTTMTPTDGQVLTFDTTNGWQAETVAAIVETDPVYLAEKGLANGCATLDATGLIPNSQLPPLAISDTFVVASQAAMLAVVAETGDVAVRTDLNKSYILQGTDPAVLGDWQELLTPTDAVLSVDGMTGVVSLASTYAPLSHTHLMVDITDSTWISDITAEPIGDLTDVTITTIATNDILQWDGAKFINVQPSVIGGAGTFQLEWKFATSTTAADPGNKNFRYNNATPANITSIYVSDISNSGIDASTLLAELGTGNKIYIQQNDDALSAILFTVVSVVDNAGWFTVNVTVDDDAGLLPGSGKKCAWVLMYGVGAAEQNLWETITANTGSAIANTATDTFSIVGSGDVSTSITGDTLTISNAASGDLASVTLALTGDTAIPLTMTDILWPTVALQNNAAVIERSPSLTNRILIKETGLYVVAFSISFNADAGEESITAQVLLNGATIVPGSVRLASEDDEINDLSNTFTAAFTAGDYITVQIMASGTGNTLHNTSTCMVTRARGTKGEKGEQGDPGTLGSGTQFHHHNAALTQTFTAATTILFNTSVINGTDYTYSAGNVTITRTGWYGITYDVTVVNATNNRTTSSHEIEVNGTLLPGTVSHGYHRNLGNGEATSSATVTTLLTIGDVVRIRSQGSASITTVADGCRLTIESK